MLWSDGHSVGVRKHISLATRTLIIVPVGVAPEYRCREVGGGDSAVAIDVFTRYGGMHNAITSRAIREKRATMWIK